MVEMAKAHNLNIYIYLNFLLEQRPTKEWTDDQFEKLAEYYDAMKSQFRQVGNHLTETGNHLLLLRVYSRKDLSNP